MTLTHFDPTSPTDLGRCLLLAALVHVWLVVTLGSAPGGTAQPGQGVWGSINISLRGPISERPSADPVYEPDQLGGSAGLAPRPRWGGAVRADTEPSPPPVPGAARLGAWAPQPTVPLPTPVVPLPDPVPASVPEPEPEPVRMVPPLPAPLPAVQPMPEPVPVEPLVPVPVPLPVTPAPAPEPEPLPAPRPATPEPVFEPLPVTPEPVSGPALQPQVQPPPERRLPAAQPWPDRRADPLATLAAQSQAVPHLAPAPDALAALAERGPAEGLIAPPGLDAGPRVGHDVATPPAPVASAPRRLNLELTRPRGGELSRGAARGVLPLLPRPPELPDKLARDIERAARPDCRDAHAGAGLLAVVPLVRDALRPDGGCKW